MPGQLPPIDDLDEIRIHNLDVRCVVGIYPREKLLPQPLVINLRLFLDTKGAGKRASLRESIDYAAVAGEIRFVLEHSHFRLLETAADALSHLLLAPRPRDQIRAPAVALELELQKPEALGGGAIAALVVRRKQADVEISTLRKNIGTIDVLHQSPDCVLYRLLVPAEGQTPAFLHAHEDVAEMALSDGLFLQGKPLAAGDGHTWPHQFPRRYVNPTKIVRTVLAVSRGGIDQFTPYLLEANPESLRELPREYRRMYYPGPDWSRQHPIALN